MKTLFLWVSIALTLLLSSWGSLAQTPANYTWSVSSNPNVSTVKWSANQISDFIHTITASDVQIRVGDFRFIDLLGNGSLELVANADISGRAFFNTVVIVRQKGSAFSFQKLHAINVESLSDVIADINNDGRQEMLVPTPLTPYLGGPFPQAKWTAIYSWSGSVYLEDSSSFASYYASNIVPTLQQALDKAKATSDPLLIALAQVEFDKASRLAAGVGSTAGTAMAQTMATSSDPKMRIWAASVLADIGSPAALATLSTLKQDVDPEVANYADSIQRSAKQDQCEKVEVKIPETINLASRKLIGVTVPIADRRGAEIKAVAVKSITFGEAGFEQSLVSCDDGGQQGIICMFRTANTGLQVGDGVAVFRAARPDGTCLVGLGAVQVVNIP